MAKPSPKNDEKDEMVRTYMHLPLPLSHALVQRYEFEKPRGADGRKMSLGRWIAEKALAKIDEDSSSAEAKPVASVAPIDTKNLENSAALGARNGVAIALGSFAQSLGEAFGERLSTLDDRLGRIEMLLSLENDEGDRS